MGELQQGRFLLDFVHIQETDQLLLHPLLVLQQILQLVLRLRVSLLLGLEVRLEQLGLTKCLFFLLPQVAQIIHQLALQLSLLFLTLVLLVLLELVAAVLIVEIGCRGCRVATRWLAIRQVTRLVLLLRLASWQDSLHRWLERWLLPLLLAHSLLEQAIEVVVGLFEGFDLVMQRHVLIPDCVIVQC